MLRKWFLAAGWMATALIGVPSFAAGDAQVAIPGTPEAACAGEANFANPPEVKITAVRWIAAPVPYCRVDGLVKTDNPGPNTVGFMIALPQSWSGRYLMVIPGGSAGHIVDPSVEHLTLGYAVATTDKGSHSTGALDMSFRGDAGRSEDYAHRGVHLATMATQAIARTYYGRAAMPRYLMGCSGGGLSTLVEAEKYPEDAEGFIAAAAPTDPYVQTFWAYVAQYVARDPKRWISPSEMARVGAIIMSTYDATDGARDGLIWDPTRIEIKRSLFRFLTSAQFSTLKLLQDGLPPISGSQVTSPGYWLSNPSLLGPIVLGSSPPPWTAATRPPLYGSTVLSMAALRGAGYDSVSQMDYADPRQREDERAIWDKVGGYDLDPARLARLRRLGGRLLFWSGAADEAIPPAYVVRYSRQVRAALGRESGATFQSFLVPAMFHCRGGEGNPSDASLGMLQAMQRWVEAGEEPREIILTNSDKAIELNSTSNTAQYVSGMSLRPGPKKNDEPRSYRICAHPAHARFIGSLTSSPRDARNWQCMQTSDPSS